MTTKTAVITGASSGIGMELAPLFAAQGYNLILTARRIERLQQLADDLHKVYGITANVIQMDIAYPFSGEALWQEISAITPDIDVLVNNAGVSDVGDFAAEVPEVAERLIRLNVSTLTLLTRYVLPGMIARKHGKILNVAQRPPFNPAVLAWRCITRPELRAVFLARHPSRIARNRRQCHCLMPGCNEYRIRGNRQGTKYAAVPSFETDGSARCCARRLSGDARGGGVVVPGWLNKFMAISTELLPSAVTLEINRYLLPERR